jgi:ABC-2 type transport system ATP-binding protein
MDKIKPLIGVVSQEVALYDNLTAKENLKFFGGMYNINKETLSARIDELIDRMELNDYANEKIKTFSGGMKRRVNLLVGVLHMPELLILDEPTVGVDVHSRSVIIEYLKELNKKGMTILYTSHMLDEAQKLCTDVAIIDYGKILKSGKTNELLAEGKEIGNLEELFLDLTGRKLRN